MLAWIVTDTTTFELELCWCKRATAHAHLQPHGVCDWTLNTPINRIVQKSQSSQRRNSNSNLLIIAKNTRNRPNRFRRAWCRVWGGVGLCALEVGNSFFTKQWQVFTWMIFRPVISSPGVSSCSGANFVGVGRSFWCVIFCVRDEMKIVQVILPHEYCWFHGYRNEHLPCNRKLIEIRRDSCSRFVGSDCFCLREHESDYWETVATHYHWQVKDLKGNQRAEQYSLWSSNVQSSHQEALLYVFQDNEAVIKMIIKGRSSTMRHASRT